MSQYEQAFRDAFATHADEAPPLPPLPESFETSPRRRARAWELVALAAAIMLVAGLGWLVLRGPGIVPAGRVTAASPAPTESSASPAPTASSPVVVPSASTSATPSASPSRSVTTPSASGSSTTAAVTALCQVPLPAQWKTTLKAGEVPKDPREMAPEPPNNLGGWPLTFGTGRYAYVALFNSNGSPVGYDGAVTEVVNGKRTDLYPINATSGFPQWAKYFGEDLVMLVDYGSGSNALIRYRRSTEKWEAVVPKGGALLNPVSIGQDQVAWLEPVDGSASSERTELRRYDVATGKVSTGPQVSGQLVAWNGLLVTVNISQPNAPTFGAYGINLKPVSLPQQLAGLRGPVFSPAASSTVLVWMTEGSLHWFRDGLVTSVPRTEALLERDLASVSDAHGGLAILSGKGSAAIIELSSGSWTDLDVHAAGLDGDLLSVGGESAWGGGVGNWAAKATDLSALPACGR